MRWKAKYTIKRVRIKRPSFFVVFGNDATVPFSESCSNF